jgi:hypothetical protein
MISTLNGAGGDKKFWEGGRPGDALLNPASLRSRGFQELAGNPFSILEDYRLCTLLVGAHLCSFHRFCFVAESVVLRGHWSILTPLTDSSISLDILDPTVRRRKAETRRSFITLRI